MGEQQLGEPQTADLDPFLQDNRNVNEPELHTAEQHYNQQESQDEQISDEQQDEQGNSDSNSEQGLSPVLKHPKRERRQPKLLTCDVLGQPTVRQADMDSIKMGAICTQGLWRPSWPEDIYQEGVRDSNKKLIQNKDINPLGLTDAPARQNHMTNLRRHSYKMQRLRVSISTWVESADYKLYTSL